MPTTPQIELILINGYSLKIKRGEYTSSNGHFIIQYKDKNIIFPIPRYKRPKIKNASGPYSSLNNEIDFIDLIIGSEGIFGMILAKHFLYKFLLQFYFLY